MTKEEIIFNKEQLKIARDSAFRLGILSQLIEDGEIEVEVNSKKHLVSLFRNSQNSICFLADLVNIKF